MAFIRWGGRCAQLLATVYADGRSKQITLLSIPGFHISEADKKIVAKKFPSIEVDWVSIARLLAEGPSDLLEKKTPSEHLDMAVVEKHLRKWAEEAKTAKEAYLLVAAAAVLTEWRATFFLNNVKNYKPNSGKFQNL